MTDVVKVNTISRCKHGVWMDTECNHCGRQATDYVPVIETPAQVENSLIVLLEKVEDRVIELTRQLDELKEALDELDMEIRSV